MTEALLNALPQWDLFSILAKLTQLLDTAAQTLRMPVMVLYLAVLCLALCVGVLGYKLVKLWAAILGAYIAYYLTGNGIVLLDQSVEWNVPAVLVYAIAILVGALFFFLAFKCFAFVFYTVMGTVGFSVTLFYTDNILFALVAAFFLALVCVLALRVSVICATSAVSAIVVVDMLSALLPSVAFIAPRAGNWTALAVIGVLTVVFAVIQFIITRKRPDRKTEPKANVSDAYL